METDAKALKELGITLKQAVSLKAIVKRIMNNESKRSDTLSPSSNNGQLAFESSVSQISESARLQVDEMFECERRYGKLEYYEKLGKGSFGTVFCVSCVKRKDQRALKVIFSNSKEEINESFREAFQLIKFNHENIVKVYDAFMSGWKEGKKEKDVVCIEMEYMKHGSLWDYYLKTNRTVVPQVIFSIIHQVATSLKYLHDGFNMVHRDIKPGNILIKKLEENTIHVCLGDFGLAKTYNHGSTLLQSSMVGTPNFFSPEMYQATETINQSGQSKNIYTEQSDVFALGVTIYQLMTGDVKSHGATLSNSGIVRKELVSKMKLQYSDNLIDLVVDMMNADPTKRPSLYRLIQSSNLGTSDTHIGSSLFEKDNSNMLQSLVEKSELGDSEAQFYLALMYADGDGIEKDLHKAIEWYETSAKQGNLRALNNLGLLYKNGDGVEKDLHKAFQLFEEAANKGNSLSQYNLALMYYHGHSVEKDFFKAFTWFKKSAKQGYPSAQCDLAFMYRNGEGTEQDFHKAFKWCEISAKQGDSNAQFKLASMYYIGEGVEKDIYKAFKGFELLAEQGFANSQFNVGAMYLNGEGVEKDHKKAIEWLTKAAQQGYQRAELCLNALANK